MGLTFPEKPINSAVWGIWSLCFAIGTYIISRKFSLLQTTFLSWFVDFCVYVGSGWKYGCINLWHSILCNSFERIGSILGDINYCKTMKKKGAITPSLTAQKAIDA